jgi:hypothetical protein
MFHSEFAEKDVHFRAACQRVGLTPSSRQASKFRRGFGLAYEQGRKAKPVPVVVEEPVIEEPVEIEDLSLLTCKVLRERLAAAGIKVKSKARKAELIAALQEG